MEWRVFRFSLLALAVAGPVVRAADCPELVPAAGAAIHQTVVIDGKADRRIELPSLGGPMVVRVDESGIDVVLEIVDARKVVLARAASPIIRRGSQLAYLPGGSAVFALVRSIEHAAHSGSANITVRAAATEEPCASIERAVAAADMRYAGGRAAAQSSAASGESPIRIFADAAKRYEAALGLQRLSPTLRATLELGLASLSYYDLSAWSASADWSMRSAATFSPTTEPYLRARARALLAAAWMEMGTASSVGGTDSSVPADSRARFEEARKVLKELEQFHKRRGEAYDAALQTNNIGLSYYYEARFAEAIPPYTAAMKVFEALGETPRLALALQNIALCEWGEGKLTAALPRFDRALAVMDRRARPNLYLLTLNSSALAHYAAGKFDESLRLNTQGLRYATELRNDYYRGKSLMGLGVTYYAIGDRKMAAQFLRTALTMLTEELDGRGRTTALRSLAIVEHDEKHYAEAVRFNLEALSFSVAASARARIKVRLGADYAAMGDLEKARAEIAPVARDPPGGDVLVRSEAQLEMARLMRRNSELSGAESLLTRALSGFQSMQSVAGEFETRVELARLQSVTQREAAAIASLREALQLSDEIAMQTGNPEYRASVTQSLRPAQELLVDLEYGRYARAIAAGDRAQANRIARETLAFADGTRAQVFGQILAQRFQKGDPALAKLQSERLRLLRDLADRRFYLSTREDRKGPDDELAGGLRQDIATLRAQLGVKNAELNHPARHASGANGGLFDFSRAPPNRMFVEYWLGASHSYAWAATRTELRWIKLQSGPRITEAARTVHDTMRLVVSSGRDSGNGRAARREMLARLYQLVVAPLGDRRGIDELLIAADGPLHIIPFPALRGVDRAAPYLVHESSVALVPALRFSLLGNGHTQPEESKNMRMLLVDDPVYESDDVRATGGTAPPHDDLAMASNFVMRGSAVDPSGLPRLTGTAREANAIRQAFTEKFGPGRIDELDGLDATRESLLVRDIPSYRYIHIASHGNIDTEVPQLSALILGKYGRNGVVPEQHVWVDDLLGKTFDADVVVLSACDTSLGAEFAGEGPIGLRYAVLARGGRSVVSSLWPVSDEITADLMTEMYGGLTNKADRADVALTMAMRKLLAHRPQLDPVLWAPYTVHLAKQK